MFKEHLHSVYDDYAVFKKEILGHLPEDIIYYYRDPLVMIPLTEIDKLEKVEPGIKKMVEELSSGSKGVSNRNFINKNFSKGIESTVKRTTLFNNLLNKDHTHSHSLYSINKNFIKVIINDDELINVILRVRARKKQKIVTSIYIDRDLYDEFRHILKMNGISEKNVSKVIEYLIELFVTKVKESMRGEGDY